MQNTVTFTKTSAGQFKALLNGEATEYGIVNGSLGLSGTDRNMYGITNAATGSHRWIGTLQACKKLVTHSILKRAKVAA